jgi:hypothetical protein
MNFVFPALLGGLLLVGIPVLLHLIMKQKPRHLLFPAFRFLLQRHRTNQRKLRLRHLILLALRVLMIALICFALSRPKLYSERLNLSADRPAAAVLVFDTSLSMEYAVAGRSRLEEAKQRALELLDELPEGSRVAVLDTADPSGEWLPSVALARDRIQELKLRPASGPITSRLPEAYRLLIDLEQDQEDSQSLLRFLYIFSDRTQECWDANRARDLQALRERIAAEVKAVFVDVGVDQPADVAITAVELPRPVVTADDRILIRATVQATGADCDTVLNCRLVGNPTVDKQPVDQKPVKLQAGQSQVLTFERLGLKPGTYQAEITLATTDALPFNNARFLTFEVHGGRRVLVLADEPDQARIWSLALSATHAFECDVRKPDEIRDFSRGDLAGYEVVCLLDVARPDEDLWERLHRYVTSDGRGVAVLPGGDELNLESYNDNKTAQKLLPGKLVKVVPHAEGAAWNWTNATYQHPLLKPFRDWNNNPDTDFVKLPRTARRYWEVKPRAGEASVLVTYADGEGRPALLEGFYDRRKVRGRLLLFTTPMDGRRGWNNYVETVTSFYPVLAQLSVRYLAGDAEEANRNSQSGQAVPIPLPPTPRFPSYHLKGPGLSATESLVPRADDQAELLLTQAVTPGNYKLFGADERPAAWFSVNAPAGESQLARVPPEQIEALLGAGAVLPVGRSMSLRDALQGHWGQPVELFPWLMVFLLLVLAVENLLANKFYRREPQLGEVGAAAAPAPGESANPGLYSE